MAAVYGLSYVLGRLASGRIRNIGSSILGLLFLIFLLELPLDMNGSNCSSGSLYLSSACVCYLLVLKRFLLATSSLGICAEEEVFCADSPDPFPQGSWSIHLMGVLP